ncbi:MAG: FAD-dependent oxidoreductase [Ferruginibacter sp.]|nr:FAD-dependent oxidoreductase [Chitinophagaceae bacterium]
MFRFLFAFILLCFLFTKATSQTLYTDVLVIGGGTGGTAAGIQSARLQVKTIIAEPTSWLGGMLTAAGVSATDGNHLLHSGLWNEFRQQLRKHYKTENLATGWVSNTLFEPHVGDSIFKAICGKEKNYLSVLYGLQLQSVLKKNNKITGAVFLNADKKIITIKSKICIDATEAGDVIAMSATAYDLGMEDAAYSKESFAPGKNNIIQDLTWAAILKDYGKGTDNTISRPDGYDSTRFFKSCTSVFNNDSIASPWNAQKMLNYGKIKNNKYMLNWPASGNDYYLNVIEDKPAVRMIKYAAAKNHTLQFIYYIQKELGYKNLGLADDEFPTTDKLAMIPYNRESRRMKGLVRINNNYLVNPFEKDQSLYRTGISVGDYPVDHHHHKNEQAPKIKFTHVSSYTIPLGCLIPEKTNGLIAAEKNISVSNIVNGTTRLQPVVLLTGQAAGALAAVCVQKNVEPRNAATRDVQQILLQATCYLMPYVDVRPGDTYWEVIQKAGATGILQGTGISEGWANKTYFYPDSTVAYYRFVDAINEFYPCLPVTDTFIGRPVQVKEAWEMLATLVHAIRVRKNIPHKWPSIIANEQVAVWKASIPEPYPGDDAPVKRKHIAMLMSQLAIDPFIEDVDHNGKLKLRFTPVKF